VSYLERLFSLRGKNALVTGAASGLGRRCAVVLAQAGARVALVDVNQAGLAETAAIIGQAVALPADVTRSDEVERMLTSAVEALGQIDIAVTCAGIALWKPALEAPEEEFDRVFAATSRGLGSLPRRSPGAAVVKPTARPFWQAARPKPSAMWVLPVPAEAASYCRVSGV
jgi:sorbose reductase